MIIDTHAHYDDEQFDEDREEILGKMQDAGIGMIMDAGSTILSWDKIVKLTEEYPFVYGAIGVHPDEVGNLDETQFARMERLLDKEKIKAVGVFVNEDLKRIEEICDKKVIDIVQLHGLEEEKELNYLRSRIVQPVIKAFCIKKEEDVRQAERSPADFILLDSGAGTGRTFEWEWIKHMERPYFLAGGIHIDNVEKALEQLKPYAIDVSSGIETEGRKDKRKMAAIMTAVRKERKL